MPNPAEILQRIYAAGFDLQTFERFPRAIGVSRGDCIVLLEPDPDPGAGLRMLGSPGWKMGDFMGVLTTQQDKPVFQWKSEALPATPERIRLLQIFEGEIQKFLEAKPA